ncbi:MAG: hypothetical protein EZS28_001779 [Streblomastix strix]|uniref:Uncharacterized protein n=1 Tax=Streblomastix strix TaxID=222440 RepID=A0A5J4X6P0_9EUKA|nr:MAG: hypothetical protein EZS28_001779 [Streblomastix strix]
MEQLIEIAVILMEQELEVQIKIKKMKMIMEFIKFEEIMESIIFQIMIIIRAMKEEEEEEEEQETLMKKILMMIIKMIIEKDDLDEVTGNELEDYQTGDDDYYSEEGDGELSYGYSDGEGGDQIYEDYCNVEDWKRDQNVDGDSDDDCELDNEDSFFFTLLLIWISLFFLL